MIELPDKQIPRVDSKHPAMQQPIAESGNVGKAKGHVFPVAVRDPNTGEPHVGFVHKDNEQKMIPRGAYTSLVAGDDPTPRGSLTEVQAKQFGIGLVRAVKQAEHSPLGIAEFKTPPAATEHAGKVSANVAKGHTR